MLAKEIEGDAKRKIDMPDYFTIVVYWGVKNSENLFPALMERMNQKETISVALPAALDSERANDTGRGVEEDAVDAAENGGIGADAQRQGQDGRSRHPRVGEERPQAVAQVVQARLRVAWCRRKES